MNNKNVLVAMSGGIDSSIAAILLKEQGYRVVGITMKTWDYKSVCSLKKEIGCCNLDSINDARDVASKYNFPYMVLDIQKEFREHVINNFVEQYLKGRTPNPCILCNTHIKWEALLKRADQLDCTYIATGHYARVRAFGKRYVLYKGVDKKKDQSYALWGLSQKCLSRTLFPLGSYVKEEVRKIALEKGFKNLVSKPESYEICFIPDNNYRNFLKEKVKGLEERVKGGNFVLSNGRVVGKHQGYPFYTVGQRKGLNLALGYPVYVINIDPKSNKITVGKVDELENNGMYVERLNFIKYKELIEPTDAITKVRYGDRGTPCVLVQKKDRMLVHFGNGVDAIAPGQAAVFYQGDDLIGGGWISGSFKQRNS